MSKSQNLVPNSNFSSYINCPIPSWDFQNISDWYNPTTATPDHFHRCANTIPWYANTYQYGHTGNGVFEGYIGLAVVLHNSNYPGYVEYAQVELTDTLRNGLNYCVSYYVSRGEEYDLAISNMGAYLSDSSMFQTTYTNFPVVASIENPDSIFLTDTMNWTLVSGIYQAHGGEKFLTIGNFRDTLNTNSIHVGGLGGTWNIAYYLIDDVSIINCDSLFSGLTEQTTPKSTLSISYSPSSHTATITAQSLKGKNYRMQVFDVMGKAVVSCQGSVVSGEMRKELNMQGFANGMYVIRVETEKEGLVGKVVR